MNDTTANISTTAFRFTVDSALLRELGERLVSTVHVALAELVKNAYDADASEVRIMIASQSSGGPTIIIEDNGSGMSPTDVANFWMRIGTTHKEDRPVSSIYGRPRTGKKGVGRFACRRLGNRLQLETISNVQVSGRLVSKQTVVSFDWNEFAPGTTVESIPCEGEETTFNEVRPTGTRLTISGADEDEWQVRGMDYLRRQLAVMATNSGIERDGFDPDPGFSAYLNDGGKKTIDIRQAVIEASWGTLDASIEDDGAAIFTLHAFGLGGKKTYRTRPIFRDLLGTKLHLGIFPVAKNEGVRDPSLLANYVLSNIIDEWGGVQLRYNGFRMYPYGNPGDDWLNIDADRGRRLGSPKGELLDFANSIHQTNVSKTLLNMFGMRNYLGQVDIPGTVPGLEPRIDRQGFIESNTFELLRQFVRMAIDWATIYRELYVRQRNLAEAQVAVNEVRPILDEASSNNDIDIAPKAAQFLRKEIARLVTSLPDDVQAETKQTLLRTVKALETISAENQNQLRHLRLVASASTLTLLFAHEVRNSISSLGASSARLRVLAKKIPDHEAELTKLSEQLGSVQSHFMRLVDMTGIVGAFRSGQRASEINVHAAMEKAVACFSLVTESYTIIINFDEIGRSLLTGPMVEGEFYAILINVLSNAIKSLIASNTENKVIYAYTETVGRKAYLRICDNGLGLDPKHFSDVFTPFISDPTGLLYDKLQENTNPEDAALFGTGSGLGLSIARDMARARGGNIQFINPVNGWAACVEIELP